MGRFRAAALWGLSLGLLLITPTITGPVSLTPTSLAGLQVPSTATVAGPGNATPSLRDWPGYQGAGNLSGQAISAGPSTNATLWTAFVGSPPPPALPSYPEAPSVVTENGTVYAASGQDGTLLALNGTTGRLLWNRPLGLPVYGTPVVLGAAVYVAMGDLALGLGALTALNASTGAPLWNATPAPLGPLVASPNLVDGLVLDVDTAGHAYAWSDQTGKEVYSLRLPGDAYSTVSVASPTDPVALEPVPGVGVVAYGAVNGTLAPWSPITTAEPVYASVTQTNYPWQEAGRPGPIDLTVGIVADDGGNSSVSQVYVVQTTSSPLGPAGKILATWTTPGTSQGFSSPATVTGTAGGALGLLLPQDNGTYLALRFSVNATGAASLTATFHALGPGGSSGGGASPPALVAAGWAYVARGDGFVQAVDLGNWSLAWTALVLSPVLAPEALADGRLYVVTTDGTLWALGPATLPPSATELVGTSTHPYWTAAGSTATVGVGLELWFSNGSREPAAGAFVTASASLGTLRGSPTRSDGAGQAAFNYTAPSVTQGSNVTFLLAAQDGGLSTSLSFVLVVVPLNDTHTTPLALAPVGPLPASLLSGQTEAVNFLVTAGPGGGPVAGAEITFNPFGGTVDPANALTGPNGTVGTTFTAETTGTVVSAGISLVAQAPGYPAGEYVWDLLVNPLPGLIVALEPAGLLVPGGGVVRLTIQVNSSEGGPVVSADVLLTPPQIGGTLSQTRGNTNGTGAFTVDYRAPVGVRAPGITGSVAFTLVASGFPPKGGFVPLTVVPNATGPASGSTPGPLAGLGVVGGYALLALVLGLAALALWEGVLLSRRKEPPSPSVWEEWEQEDAKPAAGPGPSGPQGPGDEGAPPGGSAPGEEGPGRPPAG
jgi:outer membrane protein assembly factor BamB